MDKKELKKQLDAKVKELKSICKDAKFADKLIGDLLSLKGQMEIEPMELCIPMDKVEKRLKIERSYGAYELIKFDGGYLFATNGYRIVVKPYLNIENNVVANGLYYAIETYFTLCDMAEDQRKEGGVDDYKYFLEDALPVICTYPIYNFNDAEDTISEAKRNFNRLLKMAKEAEAKLQKEDFKKDEEFKQDALIEEQINNEVNG